MQYAMAKQLFDDAKVKLNGPVRFIHKFVDMSKIGIHNERGEIIGNTCPSAMGYR